MGGSLTDTQNKAAEKQEYTLALAQARNSHNAALSSIGTSIKEAKAAVSASRLDALSKSVGFLSNAAMAAFDYRNPMGLIKAGVSLTGMAFSTGLGLRKIDIVSGQLEEKESYRASLNAPHGETLFLHQAYHARYRQENPGWKPPGQG